MTVMGPACFRYDSAVFFDEMDPLGVMHNSRFAVHVERAQTALFEHLGYQVQKLDRVYFAGLTKQGIPRGKWRMLNDKEISKLKAGFFK